MARMFGTDGVRGVAGSSAGNDGIPFSANRNIFYLHADPRFYEVNIFLLALKGIPSLRFPVTAIAAVLSRSSMTVKRSLNELENAGLIMRVRQGVGEPNRIYVLIPGKEDAALA